MQYAYKDKTSSVEMPQNFKMDYAAQQLAKEKVPLALQSSMQPSVLRSVYYRLGPVHILPNTRWTYIVNRQTFDVVSVHGIHKQNTTGQ